MMPIAAQAIDVDVGDYVPAPEGTTVGLLYLQHAERDKLYARGRSLGAIPGWSRTSVSRDWCTTPASQG